MNKKYAFTMTEVLVTLGVIGIVAAIIMPVVINKINDLNYKTAHKKAYSDLNQILQRALSENELTPRTGNYVSREAVASEWNAIKKYLKVMRECEPIELYECWARNGEKFSNGQPSTWDSYSFIDVSGRSWAEYYWAESVYVVDINGLKPPNKFGKDRYTFKFVNSQGGTIYTGLPVKILPVTSSSTLYGLK